MKRFLLRMTGVLLVASGIGAWVVHSFDPEARAIEAAGWACVQAWVMGAISYVCSRRAVFGAVLADRKRASSQTLKWMWSGMLLAVLVVAGGWWGARAVHDADFAEWVLLVTAGSYVFVLALKVFSLSQELDRRRGAAGAGSVVPQAGERLQ